MPFRTVNPGPKIWPQLPIFKQVIGCLWLALYIVTLLSLISYNPSDLGFNSYPPHPDSPDPSNFIGVVGADLAWMLYLSFGFGAYIFPALSLWCCVACFLGIEIDWRWKPLSLFFFLVSACVLLDLQQLGGAHLIERLANIDSPGGLIGSNIDQLTKPYAGRVGTGVLFTTLLIISSIYLFGINPIITVLNAFSWYREWRVQREEDRLAQAPPEEQLEIQKQRVKKKIEELEKRAAMEPFPAVDEDEEEEEIEEEPEPVRRAQIRRPDEVVEEVKPLPPVAPIVVPSPKINKPAPRTDKPFVPSPSAVLPDYMLPSLQLLNAPAGKARDVGLSDEQLHTNLELIVETLARFGVLTTPGEITPGASITRYEVYPGKGVRVDKISSLGRDLSRVLCAERINILAPIPGKDTVGIEVPNSNKVGVFLRELLESRDWNNKHHRENPHRARQGRLRQDTRRRSRRHAAPAHRRHHRLRQIGLHQLHSVELPLPLQPGRIAPHPHRSQAGRNAGLQRDPASRRPVVTDPKKVMLALRWVINEMEKRYKILAKVGVRNIASFNSRVRQEAAPAAESPQMEFLHAHIDDEEEIDEDADEPMSPPIRVPRDEDLIIPDKLPYIVVIIDELADLMQTAPADVESAVARLTAKARAAGIHLIVATQTPRREVVTGVIKTNIPARIAFQVPSGLDSRVILDENGAENLLGRGDLLYRPPGQAGLTRGKFAGDPSRGPIRPRARRQTLRQSARRYQHHRGRQEAHLRCFDVIRQEKKASTSNLQRPSPPRLQPRRLRHRLPRARRRPRTRRRRQAPRNPRRPRDLHAGSLSQPLW